VHKECLKLAFLKKAISQVLSARPDHKITIHFLTSALAGRLTPFSVHINWSTGIGRSILHMNTTVSPAVTSGLRGVTSTVIGGATKINKIQSHTLQLQFLHYNMYT